MRIAARQPGIKPGAPGVNSGLSVTEIWQPDHQQTPPSSVYTAQMVLNASVTQMAATLKPIAYVKNIAW